MSMEVENQIAQSRETLRSRIFAKHKLGRNSNFLYKVGTWAFYSKDGELEEYIKYDVNGKEVKK